MQRYMVISLILCLVCVSQFVNVRSARAQSGSPSPTAGGKLTGDVRIDSDLCCKWELTPDNQYVAFAAGTKPAVTVQVTPIEGNTAPNVLSTPLATRYTTEPYSISPNGRWVLYETDAVEPLHTQLWVVPFTGGERTLVLDAEETARMGFQYMPDGDNILIHEYFTPTSTNHTFHLQSLPQGDRRLVATFNAGMFHTVLATVSPDSGWMVVSTDENDDDRYELYAVSLADGKTQKLTNSGHRYNLSGYDSDVFWTSDSKYIIFSTRNGDPCFLCAVDLETASFKELNPAGEGYLEATSPDGRYGLVATNNSVYDPASGDFVDTVHVRKVRIEDGQTFDLTPNLPGETSLSAVHFKPGGNALLMAVSSCVPSGDDIICTETIHHAGEDGAAMQLVQFPAAADQSEHRLHYAAESGLVVAVETETHHGDPQTKYISALYVVKFDDPTPMLAAEFSPNDAVNAQLSPNGRWLAYTTSATPTAPSELYATLPGSGRSYLLTAAIGNSYGFKLTNAYVVFEGNRNTEGMFDLYSVPLLGELFLPIIAS